MGYFSNAYNKAKTAVVNTASSAKKVVTATANTAKKAVTTVANTAKKAVTATTNTAKKAATTVTNTAKKAVTATANTAKKAVTTVTNTAKKAVTATANTAKKAVTTVANTAKKAVTATANTAKKVATTVTTNAKKVAAPVVNTAKKAVAATNTATKKAVATVSNTIKGVGIGLAKVKTSTWVFRPSPITGKAGATAPLNKALSSAGFQQKTDLTLLKGGESKRSPTSNNTNGALGRDELAAKLGKTAQTEVTFGNRRVDVVSANWSADIYESKVGKTSLSTHVKSEIAKDINILTEHNGGLIGSKWSGAAKTTGKVLRPVGMAVDTYRLYDAYQTDGGAGKQFQKTAAQVGGGWAGALAGAAAGGAAGAAFAGVGAVPGAIVGGIVGAFGGEWAGGAAYDAASNTKPKVSLPMGRQGSSVQSIRWADNKGLGSIGASSSAMRTLSTSQSGQLAGY